MKHFKKLASCSAVGLLLSGAVSADDFWIDVGTNYNTLTSSNGATATDDMNQLTDTYWSSTVIFDTNGDGVYSTGDKVEGTGGLLNSTSNGVGSNLISENQITQMTPGSDTNYYNTVAGSESWILAFGWDDLKGEVNSFGGITYNEGTITVKIGTATGGFTGLNFGNMTTVMTLAVTNGGNNGIGQSLNISGKIDTLDTTAATFYWADVDKPFEAMFASFSTNQNTEPYWLNGTEYKAGDGQLPIFPGADIFIDGEALLQGQHDGSMTFERVPVPGTLALIGLGLLGLTRLSRKAA